MNYEAERAMNQKRLRMEGEPGHGVVQGNGLPLNYIDNGHQIPYQPYAGAYNTHYPPPDAFAAYGPPAPGSYAPQNLSYAPPAHQNYPHHQPFPQQQPQLHIPQSHMVQGYGDVGVHKPAWPPQPHLLPPLDTQKPLDIKHLKPEIKLEPTDVHKRPHPEEMMGGDLDQPKIKIKTDIFKPDDLPHRPGIDKPIDVVHKALDVTQKPIIDHQHKDDIQANIGADKAGDKPAEASKPEGASEGGVDGHRVLEPNILNKPPEKSDEERKPFSSPDLPKSGTMPGKISMPGSEPKKRGRPKGSTNKPKAPQAAGARAPAPAARPPAPRAPLPQGRPRATGYQYAVRPFRKDFSGIQFRRRWSDECLDSSHIPNEVYFGDVPVSTSVLFNYYDANAERERLAAHAAHIAAQKAAAAKLHAQRAGQARPHNEVTTVDSSSSDDSSGSSGSDSEDDDEEQPLKRGPGRPKGSKNTRPPARAARAARARHHRHEEVLQGRRHTLRLQEARRRLYEEQGACPKDARPADRGGAGGQAVAGEVPGHQARQARQEGAGEARSQGGARQAQREGRRQRRQGRSSTSANDSRRDGREAAAAHRDLVGRGGRHAGRAPHAVQAALQRQRHRLRLDKNSAQLPRLAELTITLRLRASPTETSRKCFDGGVKNFSVPYDRYM